MKLRALAATLTAAIALAGGLAPAATATERPTLRLIDPDSTGRIQIEGKRMRINLGLHVAAVGANFELRLQRPDYGKWQLTQIDAGSGESLRRLPERLLAEGHGLGRFFRLVIRKPGGRKVAVHELDFCPNSFQPQRVDESSMQHFSYPFFCGWGSPFARGDVWGIDRGWAAPVSGARRPAEGLRPGRYKVAVEIRTVYRRAFGISRPDGRAVLDVRAKKRRRGGRVPFPIGRQAERLTRLQPAEAPAAQEPDPRSLPDLVALPAWNITTRRREGRQLLAFASTPWNAGPAPLDIEGFRRGSAEDGVMDAFQYFFDPSGEVSGRGRVGEMTYDTRDKHGHWHLKQLVRYRLLDSTLERTTRSHKQSFCIAATDAIDLTVPGAIWQPPIFDGGFGTGEGSVCGRRRDSLWIRQRLGAGWGDTYLQSVAGQAFDITNVPNGTYYVEVEVNPGGRLFETTAANNVELRKIRLSGGPKTRTVRVKPWHGIDA